MLDIATKVTVRGWRSRLPSWIGVRVGLSSGRLRLRSDFFLAMRGLGLSGVIGLISQVSNTLHSVELRMKLGTL